MIMVSNRGDDTWLRNALTYRLQSQSQSQLAVAAALFAHEIVHGGPYGLAGGVQTSFCSGLRFLSAMFRGRC